MAFLPVVTREMGVLARRQSTYWSRAITAVIAVLTMGWLLLVSASHVSLAEVGSSIFLVLSGFCFGFSLLVGMQATSDSVSEEKREGTLGLLFLTDLRAIHIVVGKLAACSLNSFFAVLGVVPMLALAMLLGGVTLSQIGLLALLLTNTMFLSLALGIFVSTLSKNERKAMFACFVGLFVITLFPFVLSVALTDFDKVYAELVWVSPLYSFICLQSPGRGVLDTTYFPVALIFQHLLAWALLLGASRILPRCINELPPKRFIWWRNAYENYVFGKREQRRRYRAELLDRNAFLWLASRERIKPKYAWVVVGFFVLLFAWVALQFPGMLYDSMVAITIVFLVHFVLKIWTASEVCSRLINDRRSGALELLLSSPLSVRDITHGQALALRRIFVKPVAVLIIAELGLLTETIQRRPQSAAETAILYVGAAITLLIDLWALKWVGIWLSLFGKSIERVLIASVGRVMAIPWIIFVVVAGSLSTLVALQNESVPATVILSIFVGVSVVVSGAFGFFARLNVFRHFREVATQQLQSRPVRVKKAALKNREPSPGVWLSIRATLRRRWLLTGSTFFVGVIFLSGFGRQFYWRHQRSSELALIRAQGQPASGPEVGRVYPVLASNEDAFAFLQRSGSVSWTRWIQPAMAVQLFTRARKRETNVLSDCERLLDKNQPQLRAVRQLSTYQRAYLDPLHAFSWKSPVDVSGYTALLSAEILVASQARQNERVVAGLEQMLKIVELLRAQPLYTLQNFCSQATLAFGSALEHVFAARLLTPPDLLKLQLALERVQAIEPLQSTLALERVRFLEGTGRQQFGVPQSPPLPLVLLSGFSTAIGSTDQFVVQVLRNCQVGIDLAGGSRSRLLKHLELNEPWTPLPAIGGFAIGNGGVPVYSMARGDTMTVARLRLFGLGIAAERYRRQNSSLPADLPALAPAYVDRIPSDPFSDEPFEVIRGSGAWIIRAPESGPPGNRPTTEKLVFELQDF